MPSRNTSIDFLVDNRSFGDLFLLATINDDILIRFVDFDFVEKGWVWQRRDHLTPYEDSYVFRSAYMISEVSHIFVQVLVVHDVHNTGFHVLLQIGDVDDHSSF